MNYLKLAKSYKTASIETASPGQLILMLFDGTLRFVEAAYQGFDEKDVRKRNEVINNNIIKAQNIVTELKSCLDREEGGDFSTTMFNLYDYMYDQLQQSNIRKEKEPLENTTRFLTEIRDAWAQMLRKEETAGKSDAVKQSI